MLTIEEIKELIKTLDESTINEFVYEIDGEKLKLKKQTELTKTVETPVQHVNQARIAHVEQPVEQTVVNESVQSEQSYDHEIKSPMVGTFYLSSSPDSDPYVAVGDQVSKKTVVCMVEAMKLFNEIEAEVDGEIVEILAENGELVEYGQPLFGVKRN